MANSTILAIPLLSTSQTAKETTINTMVSYLERAMNDAQTLAFASGDLTLSATDFKRYFMFKATGVGATSALTITASKRLFVIDNIAGGYDLTIDCTSDTIDVPLGGIMVIYCDGTNLISVADSTVMGGGGGATTLLALTDAPSAYTSSGDFVLRVKNDLTGIEFVEMTTGLITDIDLTGIADGDMLVWDNGSSTFIAATPASGSSNNFRKDPCVAATTADVDLANDLEDGDSVDSVTLATGDRVLVKSQTAPAENGIYVVQASGAAVRATDADSDGEVPYGISVLVLNGAVNKRKLFVQTTEVISLGVNPLTFEHTVMFLGDIDDVDFTTPPTDGQTLVYDSGSGKWVPGALGAGANNIADLLDVDLTGLADGYLLVWDASASKWESVSLPVAVGDLSDVTITSVATGNILRYNGTNWVNYAPKRVLAFFVAGVMTSSELIFSYVANGAFTLPASLTGSVIKAGTAATGTSVITIKKNGSSIGTLSFAAAGVSPTITFSSPVSFASGDFLQFEAPASADATLADISFTLTE